MEQSLSRQKRLENWTTRVMVCHSSGMTVRISGADTVTVETVLRILKSC